MSLGAIDPRGVGYAGRGPPRTAPRRARLTGYARGGCLLWSLVLHLVALPALAQVVPDPPDNLTVHDISTTTFIRVALTWDMPDNTGDSPITKVCYRYRRIYPEPESFGEIRCRTVAQLGGVNRIVTPNLQSGSKYEFNVVLHNNAGQGGWTAVWFTPGMSPALTINPTSVAEDAGATLVTVSIALNSKAGTLARNIDVTVSVGGGTATSGDDYTAVDDFTVTVPAGGLSAKGTFTLTPIDNDIPEGNETVIISGSASEFVSIASATFTITDEAIPQSANANLSGLTASSATGSADTYNSLTLTPAFSANTTNYTATVANAQTHAKLTPTVDDTGKATVTVDGNAVTSGSESDAIALNQGDNAVTVRVTAEDGTTKDYIVTITRQSANANLSGLTASSATGSTDTYNSLTLTPAFSANTTNYTATVVNAQTHAKLTPTVDDTGKATVTVDGNAVTSGSESDAIALSQGDNAVTVRVTAEDGTTKDYTVTITRQSANANLSGLTASSATGSADTYNSLTLTPAFSANTTNYTATVVNAQTHAKLTPTVDDTGKATVTVDGNVVTSGSESVAIALSQGDNVITVRVTAEDRTTKDYTVTITRQSANANLSGLTANSATGLADTYNSLTLTPAFSANTTNYTATAANDQTHAKLTPTVDDTGKATVTVDGNAVTSGSESDAIVLSQGDNAIMVRVTAQDGTTKDYTVTITREAAQSSNANLSGLAASSATGLADTYNSLTLTPAFSANTTNYTATVANAQTHAKLTPTVDDTDHATVTVGGNAVTSGSASDAIALSEGDNAITVRVTAQDGTTKDYTVTITREAAQSSNADLSGLTASSATGLADTYNSLTLTPAFSANTTSYTATVANAQTHAKLTPTVDDADHATVTVDGNAVTSGLASSAIALSVGANAITVEVTAQDGATKGYTVTITREATQSSSADLSGLTASSATSLGGTYTSLTLAPTFSANTTSYTATVAIARTHAKLTPTVDDADHATVTVDGNAVTSGLASSAIALSVGANEITVRVTAQDGTTKGYTVTITREAAQSSNADLSGLAASSSTSSGGTYTSLILTPSPFSAATTSYAVTVANARTHAKLTPTVEDTDHATVTVDGSAVTSGSESDAIALSQGDNAITVRVTAQDGTTKDYTVTITREAAQSSNADLSGLTASSATGLADTYNSLTLTPAFSANTTSYTATVANTQTHAKLTPTVDDTDHATVTVDGNAVTSGSESDAIALSQGDNAITVRVTAQDGTTKDYTVTITREAAQSSNADLSGLTASSATSLGGTYTSLTLAPTFSANTISYTATVADVRTHAKLTPTVDDTDHATVTVDGNAVASGSASSAIALSVGVNAITVRVMAQDGTTKDYTVTITREAAQSSNADLSGLTASSATSLGGTYTSLALAPTFSANTTSYAATVANARTHAKLTPTVDNTDHATITVDGNAVTSGSASSAITLSVGANAITVRVTVRDGTTKDYTVTITREAAQSSNANLSGLTASSATGLADTYNSLTLTPAFSANTTNYTATVANSQTHAKLTPTVDDTDHATVTVDWSAVASGSASSAIALSVGANEITVRVIAQDGTTKDYAVTITRQATEVSPTVSLSASPNPVTEGSPVTVTATLSAALVSNVTIPLTLSSGTAEDSDYGSLTGITISSGSTTGTGTVTTSQDADFDDETFTVALGNLPSSVTAGSPSLVQVRISDDDATPTTPTVSLSASPNPVTEGSPVTVTAQLSSALTSNVTIPLTLSSGTAEDDDYGSLTSITISSGSTTSTGTVTTSQDADSDDETFTVALGNLPSSVTAGSPSLVQVRISDDDGVATPSTPAVSLSASPNPVEEGSPVTVTATLSSALASNVTIPLTLSSGMAEDDDYGSLSSITINSDSTTGTGTVTTSQDADFDNETFTVALGNLPSSVTAGSPSAIEITITDDDAPNRVPTVSASCNPCRMGPGEEVHLAARASDPDGDALTYAWSAPTGRFTGPVDEAETRWEAPNKIGRVTIRVQVSDGQDGTSSATVSIEVANAPPAFDEPAYAFELRENEDGRLRPVPLGTVLAEDPDEDEVTYALASGAGHLFAVGARDGAVTYVGPGEDHEVEPNRYELTIRARDTHGAEARVQVVVEVVNVNESPLAQVRHCSGIFC